MRMPEAGAVAVGAESVSERLAWRDWALNSGRHTVHPLGVAHSQTMPMDSSAFRLIGANNVVIDLDLNHVSPVGFNGWARELAIDEEHRAFDSIRCDLATADFEVVPSRSSCPRYVVGMD